MLTWDTTGKRTADAGFKNRPQCLAVRLGSPCFMHAMTGTIV